MKSIFFTEFVGNRLKSVFPVSIMALELISRYHIYTVYYDTDNFELIRKSIEKPIYKEKAKNSFI